MSYVPAKHPRYSSLELIKLYQETGVNAIEFGFPSANPWLDGPLIKRFHQLMRSSGIDYRKSFEIFDEIKSSINIPVFLMTYSDVVRGVGENKFLLDCKTHGFSGAIVPDMELGRTEGLMSVKFVDVYKDKLQDLKPDYDLFYLRASQAQTGQKAIIDEDRLKKVVDHLRRSTNSYIISGFGIETEEDTRKMMSYGFDGLAISTSILRAVEKTSLDQVREKIRSFSLAMRESYKS